MSERLERARAALNPTEQAREGCPHGCRPFDPNPACPEHGE